MFLKFVSALVVSASLMWAQADANKGQIVGTVTDPQQGVITGANVRIENLATSAVRELSTDGAGAFRAVLLDPGRYRVRVEAAGFAPAQVDEVNLSVGATINLSVSLQVAGVVETIVVTAPAIDTQTVALTTTVNLNAIQNLPINGRRFTDFAALTPAVQIDPTRGSISFAGQRGINGNVMVDGADYNNPFFGGMRGGERSGFVPTVPQSSVEEFQAITTGYAAEYGRSTGGMLNVITRGGTNQVRGEAFYQIRHKETGWKTPFNTQNLETLQQWGGSVGGPAIRDRLFWLASAERQTSKSPREILFPALTGVTPTAATAEAFNFYKSLEERIFSTNDAVATLGRLDYQFRNASRLTARFNFSDAVAENAITTGAPLPAIDNRARSGTGAEKDRIYTGVAQWSWILGPTMANDLRFSSTYELRPRTSNSAVANVSNQIGNFGARNFLPTTQDDQRTQIADSFTINWNRHTVKLGLDYNYLTTSQLFGFNQFGSFNFTTTAIPTLLQAMSVSPGRNRFDDPTVQYRLQIGNRLAAFNMQQLAFFAQDFYRVNPYLQLNYGVRWDGQWNPDPLANNLAITAPVQDARYPVNNRFDPVRLPDALNQWMPRFGFALTPRPNSNRTVIRGHAGLFYASTPMLLFAASTNNFRNPPGDVSFFIPGGAGQPTVYQVFNAAGINLNNFTLDKLPTPDVNQLIAAYARLTGTTPNPFLGASVTGTANDYRNPRAFQMGLGAEHEITSNWVAGIQANYINTVHLQRNRDYNLPFPTVRLADGRPVFNRANRPVPSLGQILVRESSARSMYRGVTFTSRYNARRVQFNVQYTVSGTFSDDDNERDATTIYYDNAFNLRNEYGYSSLDSRHQVTGFAVIRLPWNIELAPTYRFNSGRPIDPRAGSDLNGDASGGTVDRAYRAVGTPFKRNSFRNRDFNAVDLRFLKSFVVRDRYRVQFSTEMFNLLNNDNVIFGAPGNVNNLIYGPGITATGAVEAPRATFMRLKLADGSYDRNNSQVGTPFQAQFGLRLIF
jgi:hypothetical protein